MIADAERSDALLVDAMRGCRDALRHCSTPREVVCLLFRVAVVTLEADARRQRKIAIFPDPSRDPPLLPAFWALPYEERLSACLLLVEEMEEALASEVAGVPSTLLLEQSRRALARLQGDLPL